MVNHDELKKILENLTISFFLYLLALNLTPVPVSVCTTLFAVLVMLSLYNSSLWNGLMARLSKRSSMHNLHLLSTVKQLSLYEKRSKDWNRTRYSRQRQLTWKQQRWLDQLGYNAKIDKLDKLIKVNLLLVQGVVTHLKDVNQLKYTDLQVPVDSGDNYRVIEALCHFQRDWSALGDPEIQPILGYIDSQLAHIRNKEDTTVIHPGSGLGRIGHHLAVQNYHKVYNIEFSMLMKTFNEFIYSNPQTYQLYPFIHTYSHQVSMHDQLRKVEINTLGLKPDNLDISFQDFLKFSHTATSPNVVIVTVFFIDTLENLFNYLEKISSLTQEYKGEKTWINIGPLKYGTRPKVELNLKELLKLTKLMGWNLKHSQDPQLLGYLTDLQSMWQGQYGVSMFTCTRK